MRRLQSEQFRSLSLVFILILAPLTSFIQENSSLQEKSQLSYVNASLDIGIGGKLNIRQMFQVYLTLLMRMLLTSCTKIM